MQSTLVWKKREAYESVWYDLYVEFPKGKNCQVQDPPLQPSHQEALHVYLQRACSKGYDPARRLHVHKRQFRWCFRF